MKNEIERHMYDIEKIFEVVLAFNSEIDLNELLNIILTKMMEITHSDAGTLYTVEDGKLHFRIVRNISMGFYQTSEKDDINLPPITLDKYSIQNVSAYCAIKKEIVMVDDVYGKDERFNLAGPKNYDKMTGYQTRAMLVLPICSQRGKEEEVLGVIQLMNPIDPATGKQSVYGNIFEPPILPALAKVAANTLSNVTYLKELRMILRSFAAVMTQAIDERSPYNNNHTQKVAQYCERFAIYLGVTFPEGHKYHFDKLQTESLTLAALLHDIGKIITPLTIMDKPSRLGERLSDINYRFELRKGQLEIDWLKKKLSDKEYAAAIEHTNEAQDFVRHINTVSCLQTEQLNKLLSYEELTYRNARGDVVPLIETCDIDSLSVKKGTITNSERCIMQDHVVITGRLLDKIPFWKYYGDVPSWARSHHEFLDGSGYPNGISGEEIPMEACIIAIMDIFDALIAKDRPYKRAIPVHKAIKILSEMAEEGKLHKELVALFIQSNIWVEIA